MVTLPGIADLRARKRDLLLESEINRQSLQLEWEVVLFRTEKIKEGYDRWQVGWKWIAPIAGFLVARKFKKAQGAFAKGSMLLLVVRHLWQGWRAFQDDGKPGVDSQ